MEQEHEETAGKGFTRYVGYQGRALFEQSNQETLENKQLQQCILQS